MKHLLRLLSLVALVCAPWVTQGQISLPVVLTDTACDSYLWNGVTYTVSGVYADTAVSVSGYDSITILDLTIKYTVISTVDFQACGSYDWNGTTYTASGSYPYTTIAANGCDSIVTLNLTINQAEAITISDTACDSYTWNGATYTTGGIYVFDTVGANGCDSTVTLMLTINTPISDTIEMTAVDSLVWNDEVITTSGIYTYTYTGSNGCDSIVTLILTITAANYEVTILSANISMGSVSPEGTSYVAPGDIFTATATARTGYHFVAWYEGEEEVSIETAYTFAVNANITLTAVFEADPMVSYTITAVPNDPSMGVVLGSGDYVARSTVTLIARPNEGHRFLRWNNGVTDSVLTFIATEDVSLIAIFSTVGIDDIDDGNVGVYAADNRIVVKGAENESVYIYDVNGSCVRHQATVTDETVEFSMTATGVYLVKVGNAPAKRVVVLK